MTLKMTTAQVVETSVTVTNSSFQNYTHPDDHTRQTIKHFTAFVHILYFFRPKKGKTRIFRFLTSYLVTISTDAHQSWSKCVSGKCAQLLKNSRKTLWGISPPPPPHVRPRVNYCGCANSFVSVSFIAST